MTELTWDTQYALLHTDNPQAKQALVYALSCTNSAGDAPAYHLRNELMWMNMAFLTQELNDGSLMFPAGLLPRAVGVLDHIGCPYTINRVWEYPTDLVLSEPVPSPDPRPHQVGGADRMIMFGRASRQAAPRSGKTWEIFMLMAKLGLRALVISHEVEWCKQLFADFQRIAGDKAHMIGCWFGGKKEPGEITVASAAALNAALRSSSDKAEKYLQTVGCLIFDEGDFIAGTNMAHKIARHCVNAPYVFGFSATFTHGRSDGSSMAVEALCGPIVMVHDSVDAEEMGFHAEGKATFIQMPGFKMTPVGIEWRDEYEQFLLHNPYRNLAIAYMAHRAVTTYGWSTLILTHEVSQAEELVEMLDPMATLVTGKTTKSKRETILEEFLSGERRLVVTTLYKRAVNLPELDCCILAGGGKSASRFIQAVYRPKTASETRAKVSHLVDFLDNTHTAGKEGRLTKHSAERYKLLKADGGWEIRTVELGQLAGFKKFLFQAHPNGIAYPAVDNPAAWEPEEPQQCMEL